MWKIIGFMAVTQWGQYVRLVRGSVLSLRERAFVHAAQAIGPRQGRILLRHILPNASGRSSC
jgi:peptide/nickel transport system permease protein